METRFLSFLLIVSTSTWLQEENSFNESHGYVINSFWFWSYCWCLLIYLFIIQCIYHFVNFMLFLFFSL